MRGWKDYVEHREVRARQPSSMNKKIKLERGQQFDRLTIIGECKRNERGGVYYMCQCDCGHLTFARGSDLVHGRVKSCGCKRRMGGVKKGSTVWNVYRAYYNAYRCCNNPKSPNYAEFGGRGVEFCEEWDDKVSGLESFTKWSYLHGATPTSRLHRRDMNGDFTPENCYWWTPGKDG